MTNRTRRDFIGLALVSLSHYVIAESAVQLNLPPLSAKNKILPDVESDGKTLGGEIAIFPPTAQTTLDGSVLVCVFMDTGTGNPLSGTFGNVRKDSKGRPRFHEGIDIAPVLGWNKVSKPKDVVKSAVAGKIVYVNRKFSSYGNYIVILSKVPNLGGVYTLYAHLQSFDSAVKAGKTIQAGTPLGILGNTPNIPLQRSHLHFEIGLVLNRHYEKFDDDHGVWNGGNLFGFNPIDAFRSRKNNVFPILKYLQEKKVAFRLELYASKMPDFFVRYPVLWKSKTFIAGRILVSFSKEGIPLSGEISYPPPPGVEPETLPNIVEFDMDEIEKGRPFVVVKNGLPKLTVSGEKLLKIFFL